MTKSTERVVVSVKRPGTERHVEEIDKFPVTEIDIPETQVFANRRRDVQAGVLVSISSGTFITEHVLPVVCLEGADIFPLRVANFHAMPNRHPPPFAN